MQKKERGEGKGEKRREGGRKGGREEGREGRILSVSYDSTNPAGEIIESWSGHLFKSVSLKEMTPHIRCVCHT